MVGKLFRVLGKEIGGVHQAAYVLAGFTFLSQILALVRDRMLAHFFGAGSTLDIYYAAFRVPDLVFVSVASIVSVSVLVPVLSEKLEVSGREAAKKFLQSLTSFFLVLIVVFSAILFFLLPFIQPLLFPGFDASETAILVTLSQILLLSPILLGLSNILGGINQTMRRFFVYALSPILYNFGIIVGIVFLQETYGIAGVVYGVVFGAALHLLAQIPFVVRSGLFPTPTIQIYFKEVWQVLVHSLPRTLTLGSTHITLLVLIAIASTMTEGSIAVFNFSFNLQSVPLAIIGVSYSLAAFPTLSRLYSSGKVDEYVADIVAASRHIIFWSLPIIGLFVVLRAQIVRVILGSGSFDWSDTRLTAAALAFFVISVVFQSLTLLFVRGFYAAQKTKIPFFVNLFSTGLTIVLAFVLVNLFNSSEMFAYFIESLLRISDIPGTEVVMLAFAFALGASFNSLCLVYIFRSKFHFECKALLEGFFRSSATAVSVGVVAYIMLSIVVHVFDTQTLMGIFLQGFISGMAGLGVGYFLLKALGSVELEEIETALSRKFKKVAGVIAPEQDVIS